MNPKHIIITTVVILLVCSGTASAWLSGYDHRMAITVNNGEASPLTYYQFNFTNDTNILVAAGHMQASGADCRITNSSDTLIPFWNETAFNASGTKIWANATTLAVGDNTFYRYYGKSPDSSVYNKDTTFPLCDNFTTSSAAPATFQRYAGNPIVGVAAQDERLSPSVVYNTSWSDPYRMYYGVKGETPDYVIWCSNSSDGIDFSYYGSNPILNQGTAGAWDDDWVGQPFVLYHDGWYWMYYGGHDGDQLVDLGLAKSSDGINFTRITNGIGGTSKVLETGSSGAWDDYCVKAPMVFVNGSTWYMYYSGQPGSANVDWRVGLATSSDGVTWTRITDGPWGTSEVIRNTNTDTWDRSRIMKGMVFYYESDNPWKMYYYASDETHAVQGKAKIGFAESSDMKNWTKHSLNSVLYNNVSNLWEDHYTTMPFFMFTPELESSGIYGRLYYGGCGSTTNCYNTLGVCNQTAQGDFVHFYPYSTGAIWTTLQGSFTTDGGNLASTSGYQQYGKTYAESNTTHGVWEFDFKLGGTTAEYTLYINFIQPSSDDPNADHYEVLIRGDGVFRLRKRVSAVTSDILNPGWTQDTNWHTGKVTRSSSNIFKLYLDDTLEGTSGTEADILSSYRYLIFEKSNNYIDDVIIRKYADPEPTSSLGAEEDAPSAINIVLGANQHGMLRKDVDAAQNFSTIAAGIDHDRCYTWWDSTNDRWESYRVGYSYNAGKSVPEHDSYFVLMDGTGTTISCNIAAAETVAIPAGYYATYLRESTNKTLSAIKTDMGGNVDDLWAFNSSAGAWTDTGTFSVLQNQGLMVNSSTGFSWDGAVP